MAFKVTKNRTGSRDFKQQHFIKKEEERLLQIKNYKTGLLYSPYSLNEKKKQ